MPPGERYNEMGPTARKLAVPDLLLQSDFLRSQALKMVLFRANVLIFTQKKGLQMITQAVFLNESCKRCMRL